MVTDCLIVGHNDEQFPEQVAMLRAMGTAHPNWRDLDLNFIDYEGVAYRAMDILDRLHFEGREDARPYRRFHNAEVLWMVILYLGSYLARRGFTFDYVNLFQFQKDELRDKLRKNRYHAVAVTTTIYNFDSPITEVVNFVREHAPGTPIVVGGPYIAKRSESMTDADLEALFAFIGADFYVRSREGEQALVALLAALKEGGPFEEIPNLGIRRPEGSYALTRAEQERNSLQDNPIDYALFPPATIGDYVNLRITKGCPFRCAFCSFPLRTDKYNVSQLDAIERELDAIRALGTVTGLFFTDDTVNVPLPTFKDMLRLMIAKNYGFQWHCFFRADFCDEETVELMARAGCEGVFLGLESANDRLLENMHKTPRKEHYRRVIPLFKAAGIQVFASLFFGFPGETQASAQETMDFLEETKPDFYRSLIWYCDPVTPIWDERDKYGLKGFAFSWSHDTMAVDEACELMERSFLSSDRPLWVPDPGFNFVSLFLLRNRGMNWEQIKTFLACFNALVREKILRPGHAPSPHLIENLRRAAQYDRGRAPDMGAVEMFSAARYRAAEAFFLSEFEGAARSAARGAEAKVWQRSKPVALDRTTGETPGSLAAALAAALLRLRGTRDVTIALADGAGALPLRLAVSEAGIFSELAAVAGDKIAAARRHAVFWPRIRDHVLTAGGAAPLRFAVGLVLSETTGTEGLADHDTALILRARCNGALAIEADHTQVWSPDAVDDVLVAMAAILRAAADDPDLRLGDVELGSSRPARAPAPREATFHF